MQHIDKMSNSKDEHLARLRQIRATETKEERKARIQQIVAEKRARLKESLPAFLKENEECLTRLEKLHSEVVLTSEI
jgi:hypothetical protein